MPKVDIEKAPTPEDARAYVRKLVFDRGGLREAFQGFSMKTLPLLAGSEREMTVRRFIALLFRVMLVLAIAVYPLLLRKTFFPNDIGEPERTFVGPPPDQTALDAIQLLWKMISTPQPIDWVLALIAVTLTAGPKLVDRLGRREEADGHGPHYKLSEALDAFPAESTLDKSTCDEAIRLTLHALKEDMLKITGEERKSRLTDVTLLEFCDERGTKMQVRARTANHEPTRRPIPSERLMAYYVAMIGRSVAEHDFTNKKNPFPPIRVSVLGAPPITYKSVLFLPIIRASNSNVLGSSVALQDNVTDYCLGVVCVHSARKFWFWRWGDHKKTTGGFADVATDRALPYISLLTRLLSSTAPLVPMEAK